MEYGYYRDRLNEGTAGRYDLTPLFEDPVVLGRLVEDLLAPAPVEACTHVAAIDALGFPLGGYLAAETGLGLVAVRKGGKLPLPDARLCRRTVTDYSGETKRLELSRDLVDGDTRALLVDDWIETGAQAAAAASLIEQAGGRVEAVTVLRANREAVEGTLSGYRVHSIG